MRKPHEASGARTLFLFLVLAAGISLAAFGASRVQGRIGEADFKGFVQDEAARLLNTDVTLQEVRYAPPFQIVLRGVQVSAREGSPFSIVRAEKIRFGYGLLNLLRRDFRVPGQVVLESPRIEFQSGRFPFPIVGESFSKSRKVPAQFGIRHGEFIYPWGEEGRRLELTQVHFQTRFDPQGRIQIRLNSKLGGVAEGKIEIRGHTDLKLQHYQLKVHFDNVNFLTESGLPLRSLNGRVYVSESLIETEGLSSFFHDWKVEWQGRLKDWQKKPELHLSLLQKSREVPLRFDLDADFKGGTLVSSLNLPERSYSASGTIAEEGKTIRFSNLHLPRGYEGEGFFDRRNGNYEIEFHRGERRFKIESNLNRLEFNTHFQLEHASVANLDWVVSGRALLAALPKPSRHAETRFKGTVQTDYMIVDYQPFEEFQGSFEAGSEGIQAIDFNWGGLFHLGGRIFFRGSELQKDLVVGVGGFSLGALQQFAGRPLPENLSGTLAGRLKLQGEFGRPEVLGYFTITDGTLGRLDFDQAIIQFQGFPPYLKLYDSKIMRGRNTLKLTGAIDLSLQNIFHGIRVQSPDHLVILKGMELTLKSGGTAVQAEKPLGRKVSMGLEVGTGGESQDENRRESHAWVGSKVKF